MNKHHIDIDVASQRQNIAAAGANGTCTCDTVEDVTAAAPDVSHQKLHRGLTTTIASVPLRNAIWLRALTLANRFRVMRTIDIAVRCFAERPFKAALSAAQRAVRGMVKAKLLARYRTNRYQTVYGLTQRGAAWLEAQAVEATASVRRVTDMTNPEHRLWAQFLTLCCEARGLRALVEQELLQVLSKSSGTEDETKHGLLTVASKGSRKRMSLRPDAIAIERDGITWFEVDRSARGSNRAESLRALAMAVGTSVFEKKQLRRVIVFSKTERIRNRVVATLSELAEQTRNSSLTVNRRWLSRLEPDTFEVWQAVDERLSDGRIRLIDVLVGHVIVQQLPTWLPKVRMDGRGEHSTAGWFYENYLPYRRAPGQPKWQHPDSLLHR